MLKINTDKQKIKNLLTRGVEEIIERESLEKKLRLGKQLRIKFGIDPTAPDLHLGHSVVLRKLKQFQGLGHKIILIIGDFTAKIGDPSGRSETRKPLAGKEIKQNMKKYLFQAAKIIDIKKSETYFNSKWFSKEGINKIMELSRAGSIQQVLRRADFKRRIKEGEDITVSELLYPLLQGYDSVKTRADVEIGGTDQKFNLLMGRKVQRHFKIPEQDIMTLPLLEGIDGERKMSKSYGNYIGISEKPTEMFNKTMSIPDDLIIKYFTLLTDLSKEEIMDISGEIEKGGNPRDFKIKLAEEIVKIYHGEKAALKAREEFISVFSKKEAPKEAEILKLPRKNIVDALAESEAVKSKSEARRLASAGGVKIGGEKITDLAYLISEKDKGKILQIGKKRFYKIRIFES